MRTIVSLLLLLGATAAAAETLELANGDKLSGEIVESTDDFIVIEHPMLGRIQVARSDLKPPEPEDPGLFGIGFLRGWSRKFDIGLNGQQGNTDVLSLTTGLALDYADDERRWKVGARYNLVDAKDEGSRANNARLGIRRDWLLAESRFFYYAGSSYEYDEFESWLHRVTVQTGPGLHILEGEVHFLDTTLGVAYTREFGDRDDDLAELVWGVDYRWQIAEKHVVTFDNSIFWNTLEQDQFRNVTNLGWALSLVEDPALSLNLGVQNEYENQVEPGDEKNDLSYFVTLGLGF